EIRPDPAPRRQRRRRRHAGIDGARQSGLGGRSLVIILLGVVSAALFYGDALITPAISVLSAVEGLSVAAPALQTYVVPLTFLILFALFAVQSHGTTRVATFFGPITLVWFIALAIGGLAHIAQNPGVLAAFNPAHGVMFLAWVCNAWRRLPRPDRLRGALRQSRSFRQRPDPDGVAQRGSPCSHPQLFRPRCAAAGHAGSDRKPFLSALSGVGAASDGRPCHRRHGNCQPSGHHRSLLARQPGGAA